MTVGRTVLGFGGDVVGALVVGLLVVGDLVVGTAVVGVRVVGAEVVGTTEVGADVPCPSADTSNKIDTQQIKILDIEIINGPNREYYAGLDAPTVS